MAMTTFARGVPAAKRAVGAFTSAERSAIDGRNVETSWDVRSAITADAAERRTVQREQAWIDRAGVRRHADGPARLEQALQQEEGAPRKGAPSSYVRGSAPA